MTLAGSATDPPSVAAARLLQVLQNEFAEGLDTARSSVATAPGADAQALRTAYLELFKLSLCDLCGTTTSSVARTREGVVMSRELAGEELRLRAAGLDWPLHGLTMVGLARLDDLQACVEHIARDGIPGDLIETGCWRGGASMLMRATLDTLPGSKRTVWIADSFQGFPQPDEVVADGDEPTLSTELASCDFLAVSLQEVRENFARFGLSEGVSFVPGFFEDTLPTLSGRNWALVRLDGDTYDSTMIALRALYPGVQPGGYVIVDDYRSLEECRAAVDEFRREHRVDEPLEEADWNSVRWRREHASVDCQEVTLPPATRPATSSRPPVGRAVHQRVPAIEELRLGEELERVRERLARAEKEVAYLTGSPLRGPRRWLGRVLRGAG